jgi:hypothetical protein
MRFYWRDLLAVSDAVMRLLVEYEIDQKSVVSGSSRGLSRMNETYLHFVDDS